MTGFIALPSTQQRNQAYTGTPQDDFSKLMYKYRTQANDGFTALDFDWMVRNYKKKSFAIFEIKTGNGQLSAAQKIVFQEIGRMLKIGADSEGWKFYGIHVLSFEHTSFANGRAYLNGKEITQDEFLKKLSIYF